MKKLFMPILLALVLSFGVVGAVSAQVEAEIQKLTEDFQNGKVDMATFQKRLMELQQKAMQQYTTPEQRQQLDDLKSQQSNPSDLGQMMQGLGGMVQDQEAKMSIWTEMNDWKIAQYEKYQAEKRADFKLPFPSSIPSVVPKVGLEGFYVEDEYELERRRAELDVDDVMAKVSYYAYRGDYTAEQRKDEYNDTPPARTEYGMSIWAVNPRWISVNDSFPKGDAKTAANNLSNNSEKKGDIKSFSWGAGLRGKDEYGGQFAVYQGWSSDGSVYFELSIMGSYMPNVGEWDAMAEKLAAVAAKDCTWAKLVK